MERIKSRLGWALTGALALTAVLALARATVAGPLDPPGPVASTMRTLDELVPSWGKTLTSSGGCASQRFTCVLSNVAVLDHETGLVWERVPSASSIDFLTADQTCREAKIGGRYGWRLPAIDELLSLDDDTTADSLPTGHPFTNAPDTYLWSQTADSTDAQRLQTMTFLNGGNGFSIAARARFGFNAADNARPWCVRGQGTTAVVAPDEQPAWSRRLSATGGCTSARFTCVMNNEAVLDHETGLVWQRSPSTSPMLLHTANFFCAQLETGGRFGWRMPKTEELFSLLDPTQKNNNLGGPPALPVGHPFLNVSGDFHWVKDRYMPPFNSNTNMSILFLRDGIINSTDTTQSFPVWCVRGAGGSPTPW